MVLHKMVNGKRIELSGEEESKMAAEWKANKIENEQDRFERKKAKEIEISNRNSVMVKLRKLGLDYSDIEYLVNKEEPYELGD